MNFSETSVKPELDHNVYILGAGFSVDGGMPVISNFLQRMGDSLEWLDSRRDDEIRAIQNVFKFRLRAAAAAYRATINVENIEELFSLASATGSEEISSDVTTAIAATLDFARYTAPRNLYRCEIQSVHPEGHRQLEKAREGLSLYRLYGEALNGYFSQDSTRARNSVITFNYDTLLEDGLAEADIPFTYGFPKSSVEHLASVKCVKDDSLSHALPVYKLHGSVNWSRSLDASDGIRIHGSYADVRDAKERVLLLPPTWQKVFGGHLNEMLRMAVKALTEATRIIIVGFSMPPTDTHFKYLLAAGLQNNISLRTILFVNPGLNPNTEPQESQRLKDNLFSILRLEMEKLGLITLVPKKAIDFLLLMKGDGSSSGIMLPKRLESRLRGHRDWFSINRLQQSL